MDNMLIANNMGSLAFGNISKDKKETANNTLGIGSFSGISQMLAEALKTLEEIPLKEEDYGLVQGIYSQKLSYLENDIIYSFKKRLKDYLDKVEEDIKKKKPSGSGKYNIKIIFKIFRN